MTWFARSPKKPSKADALSRLPIDAPGETEINAKAPTLPKTDGSGSSGHEDCKRQKRKTKFFKNIAIHLNQMT